MKIIIAGGREYNLKAVDRIKLDMLREQLPITEVVCGMARGADLDGKSWAESRGIPVQKFYADWDRYKKRAGPIRNGEMANYADGVILFPGGTGTNDMFAKSLLQKKKRPFKIIDLRG